VFVVTGGNAGIGLETVVRLCQHGATGACVEADPTDLPSPLMHWAHGVLTFVFARAASAVVMASRSAAKMAEAQELVSQLASGADYKLHCLSLDLSSLQSVEEFVDEFHKLRLPLHCLVRLLLVRLRHNDFISACMCEFVRSTTPE
jgi:NAD(P)-dependent dehydrogenase (short-subunit alcohol dehydrogenase family)